VNTKTNNKKQETKKSIPAAPKEKDINTVKLSDVHLSVINAALETYYRLKAGQIDMALDIAYNYKIKHEQSSAISTIIRSLALPELSVGG